MVSQNLFPVSSAFPQTEIESRIREALRAEQGAQQILRPVSASDPEIDSLVVVEIICVIEEAIGINLPTSFAPRGGYEDVDSCVSDLISKTRVVWDERVKKLEKQYG
jgi:acyl carrier protein